MGEARRDALRVGFDRAIKLEFHGAVLVQRVRDAPNQPPLSDRRRDFGPQACNCATPARSTVPYFEDEG